MPGRAGGPRNLDLPLLTHIVAHVGRDRCTLASLACASRALRQAVHELHTGRCENARCEALLGVRARTHAALQRCRGTERGAWRRQLLLDVREAQERGVAYSGADLSWDLADLPPALLARLHLLVTDGEGVACCYDASGELLGAVLFPGCGAHAGSRGRRARGPPGDRGTARRVPRLTFCQLSMLLLGCGGGAIQLEPPARQTAAHYLPADGSGGSFIGRHARRSLDDDHHMLGPAILRSIARWTVLGGPLWGTLGPDVADRLPRGTRLRIRLLDVTGSTALPDASLARLL